MGRRPDPWLVSDALIVHAQEAHLLLPVVEAGLREYRRMGAVQRLEAVSDLLARWQLLAEQHDERLRGGSAIGTPVSGDAEDRSDSGRVGPRISASAAAEQLNCSDRWVRRLCSAGELDAHRGAGGCWNIETASVVAYRRRSAA